MRERDGGVRENLDDEMFARVVTVTRKFHFSPWWRETGFSSRFRACSARDDASSALLDGRTGPGSDEGGLAIQLSDHLIVRILQLLGRSSSHMLAALYTLPIAALRLVCCDVDGTLLTPEHRPTPQTVSTVLRTLKHVPLVACTGRGRAGAYNALGPIGDALRKRGAPGVFLNGLITYGPGGEDILSERTVPPEIARAVAAFAAERGAAMVAFQRDRILCDAASEWTDLFPKIYEPTPVPCGPWSDLIDAGAPLNKLIVLAPPERHTDELRPALSEMLRGSASLTMAIPTMLEVLPKGGSKGEGVKLLLERLGVDAEEVLAIGDVENDLGMLKLAGTSVAMGNAPPSVQRVCDHVTASNEEGDDGAARALERFVLGVDGGEEERRRAEDEARAEAEEALLGGGTYVPGFGSFGLMDD